MPSWMAQFFYDLLARIVPGSILLVALWIVLTLPWNHPHCEKGVHGFVHFLYNAQDLDISVAGVVSWILVAYLASFLLSELWDLTCGKYPKSGKEKRKAEFRKQIRSRMECQCNLIGSAPQDHVGSSESLEHHHPHIRRLHPDHIPDDIQFIRDQLRLVAPSVTRQLLKLRSEGRQCEVLMLGLSMLTAVDLLFWWRGDEPGDRVVVALIFTVTVALLYLKRDRLRAFGTKCAINSYAMRGVASR